MKLIDFVKKTNNNKLIVTDNSNNVTKMIRVANKEIGMISKVKVVTLEDLAKEIIINNFAKEGKVELIETIDNSVASYLVGTILIGTIASKNHFIPKECLCDSLYGEILTIINQIRSGKQTDEYKDSTDNKITQIKELICEYEKILKDKKLYDSIRVLKEALSIEAHYCENSDIGLIFFNDLCSYNLEERRLLWKKVFSI